MHEMSALLFVAVANLHHQPYVRHQKKSFELRSKAQVGLKTAMMKSTLYNNQLCLTRRRIVFTNTNS